MPEPVTVTMSAIITALSNLVVLVNNLLEKSGKHKAELLAIRNAVIGVQAAVLDEKKERLLAESEIMKFIESVEEKLKEIADDLPKERTALVKSQINPLRYVAAVLSAAVMYLTYEVIHLNHALAVAHIIH